MGFDTAAEHIVHWESAEIHRNQGHAGVWENCCIESCYSARAALGLAGCGRMIGPYPCCSVVCGDCLELMKALPDGCVVISDPPYNVGYHYEGYRDRLSESDYAHLVASALRAPSVVIHYPEDMFDVAFSVGQSPCKCASWTYNAHTPRKWRMAAWFGVVPDFSLVKQPFKNPNDRRILAKLERGEEGCTLYDWWHVEQIKNVSGEKTEHPCQIPTELMEYVIGVTPADIIVDPFMGSGTTGVAAKKLGRHFLGFERDEDYCRIARERIALVEAQPTLFEPKPEQLTLGGDE